MISIELVPRSPASLRADLLTLSRQFSSVRMVNIPDLLRFELRSWDACALALPQLQRAIPHIRAMDFAVFEAPALARKLGALGLTEALVVRGDPPQDLARPVHATSSVELIAALGAADPGLRLYAALDPYRQSLARELELARNKLDAGAVGFFTQPFFDLGLLRVFKDLLPCDDIFWGVAPVTSAKSRRYWEVKNHAVFPSGFELTLSYNRAYAEQCLEFAQACAASLYFMPIRTSLVDYLSGLL